MASKYRNTGQTCVCSNRILVQDGIYETLAEKLCHAVASLKVGNGLDVGVVQGPLTNEHALARVEEPHGINADHASTSRNHWAHWFDAAIGQWI